jgi:hypothetical protein
LLPAASNDQNINLLGEDESNPRKRSSHSEPKEFNDVVCNIFLNPRVAPSCTSDAENDLVHRLRKVVKNGLLIGAHISVRGE